MSLRFELKIKRKEVEKLFGPDIDIPQWTPEELAARIKAGLPMIGPMDRLEKEF